MAKRAVKPGPGHETHRLDIVLPEEEWFDLELIAGGNNVSPAREASLILHLWLVDYAAYVSSKGSLLSSLCRALAREEAQAPSVNPSERPMEGLRESW